MKHYLLYFIQHPALTTEPFGASSAIRALSLEAILLWIVLAQGNTVGRSPHKRSYRESKCQCRRGQYGEDEPVNIRVSSQLLEKGFLGWLFFFLSSHRLFLYVHDYGCMCVTSHIL